MDIEKKNYLGYTFAYCESDNSSFVVVVVHFHHFFDQFAFGSRFPQRLVATSDLIFFSAFIESHFYVERDPITRICARLMKILVPFIYFLTSKDTKKICDFRVLSLCL